MLTEEQFNNLKDQAEDVLSRVDILEYMQQYLPLVEENGEWWCLSPFKEEKTPSFSVTPATQMFYDFSAGFGGNLLNFVRRYHHCTFAEAVAILKRYAGDPDVSEENLQARRIQRLSASSVARKYKDYGKKQRTSKASILPADYMERYPFDESKLQTWVDEGIAIQTMREFSVRYDPVSNRIVYPIRDMDGNIISVCGRTLDPDYKSKGLRKYTYFQTIGTLDTIYGFSDNRWDILQKNEIILFEGAKSVMLANGWGILNTGAIMTSHLNPTQFQHLLKLGCRVVFALDEEIDITKDANIQKLMRYVRVDWVKNQDGLLSPKMAPVDAGKEVWEELYERRVRLN